MDFETLTNKTNYTMKDLTDIMALLRSPEGCPWDRAQDHASIRNNFIEETYEVVEGIDSDDNAILKEELGDVLLQVVFHAVIAEEEGAFTMEDVISGICQKLIFRHPHIFSNYTADSPDEAISNWEELKKKEKGQKTPAQAVCSVSSALPALMRGQKLCAKARKNGFDIPEIGAKDISELALGLENADEKEFSERLGKLLFAVCSMADDKKTNAEQALFKQNAKFCDKICGI